MMRFEVERDGQRFLMESPSQEEAMKALQQYSSGGVQQAAAPGTEQEPSPPSEGRWAPNPLTMAYNLPGDLAEVGGNMAQAVAHPIDTAKGIYNMGWDGFKDMIYSQYGTYDNFVNYVENHPASFGMDASMLGGPAGAAIKATGMAGKAGMLGKAATMGAKVASGAAALDPFAAAVSAGKKFTRGAGKVAGETLGQMTGAQDSIAQAAKAGYEGSLSGPTAGKALALGDKAGLDTSTAKGSDAGEEFWKHHTGKAEGASIVDEAQEVLKSKKFREVMEHNTALKPILNDTTQLDIAPVLQAVADAVDKKSVVPSGTTGAAIRSSNSPHSKMREALEKVEYFRAGGIRPKDYVDPKALPGGPGKGWVMTSPGSPAVMGKGKRGGQVIKQRAVKPQYRKAEWSDLPDRPDTWKMNTFDLMRKDIGELYHEIPYGEPIKGDVGKLYYTVRSAVDNAYKTTSPNAKTYGHILDKSRKAMDEAEEIVKTFSLKEGTAKDTALRKLYSAARPSTVAGGFGHRSALAQALVDMGHTNLMHQIAGEATRPLLKNSLHALVGTGGLSTLVSAGASPWFMATLVAFSPKTIGRAAYTSGKVAGSIIKPTLAIERALRRKLRRNVSYPLAKKTGIGPAKLEHGTKKVTQYGSAQAGKMADVGENKEELRANLLAEAQKRGYQIHERVLNNLADQIMSDDPDRYLQGVRNVGRNPRLLKLFMDMGTKGEQ